MLEWLRARKEWQLFAGLRRADPPLAAAWWAGVLLRGVLPAALAILMGRLVRPCALQLLCHCWTGGRHACMEAAAAGRGERETSLDLRNT
jgi:hypothetical protein